MENRTLMSRSALSPRLFRRSVTVLGLALLALVGFALPASAHTELTGSDPADGATVITAPASVTLSFNEGVQDFALSVVVTGPDGAQYAAGEPVADGTSVSTTVNPLGSAGIYTVAYRIVSADDHPVTGQVTFAYAPPPVATTSPAGSAAPTAPASSSLSSASSVTAAADRSPTISPVPTSTAAAATAASSGTGTPFWVWVLVVVLTALLLTGGWFAWRSRTGNAG